MTAQNKFTKMISTNQLISGQYMLNKIIYSSSLILTTVATLSLPSNPKPLTGVYWPYSSDISLEIENNRF